MEHVTLTDLRKLVLLEGGKTDPRVVEHLASGCRRCGRLIRREVIDSGRLTPKHNGWHASDRELRVLIEDLPSASIEVLSHLRDGCPYCAERARSIFDQRSAELPDGRRTESRKRLGWSGLLSQTVPN